MCGENLLDTKPEIIRALKLKNARENHLNSRKFTIADGNMFISFASYTT